jgi:hypothetical protein
MEFSNIKNQNSMNIFLGKQINEILFPVVKENEQLYYPEDVRVFNCSDGTLIEFSVSQDGLNTRYLSKPDEVIIMGEYDNIESVILNREEYDLPNFSIDRIIEVKVKSDEFELFIAIAFFSENNMFLFGICPGFNEIEILKSSEEFLSVIVSHAQQKELSIDFIYK